MKNNQAGFIGILVAVIVALVIAGGVYFYNKQENKESTPVSVNNQLEDNTPVEESKVVTENQNISNNWKIYTDNFMKMSFKYPSNWKVVTNTWTTPTGLKQQVGDVITFSTTKIPLETESIYIGGAQIDCESLIKQRPGKVECVTASNVPGNPPVYNLTIDSQVTNVFFEVVKSIKSIEAVTKSADAFVNDGEKTPKIYSITPNQTDRQNTSITIKGKYLNGFEGNTAVWFENESGQSGIIGVNSYAPQGATTLTFTLPNQLCTKNMGESGLPCSSYMGMRPGLYKVFVQPFSMSSNKLDFYIKQ